MSKTLSNEIPKIDTGRCIGCGICVQACPVQVIRLFEGKAQIDQAHCQKCRICVQICPHNAIE